ncbi:MAG: GTPase, partial [archaeon]
MPINASHEYFAAEKKFHLAQTPVEKLKALEEMLKTAPSHKGAEVLRSELKQRLSKLRSQIEKQSQQKSKGYNISVKKEGSAQVAIVSITNAGKSLLLSKLTNAKPEIAEHEYTTRKIEMGVLDYEGIKIQLIEIPAIHKDFAYKGRGPTYFSIIRNVDLIVIILDLTKDIEEQKKLIEEEFEKAQIKLNKEEPPIIINKNASGGITILGKAHFEGSNEDIMKLLRDSGVHNAEIEFYEKATIEDLTEALNDSIAYKTAIYVYNKTDLVKHKEGISAKTEEGLNTLQTRIWKKLGMIKVFTKMPGKKKNYPPVALDSGSSIRDMAAFVHKDFVKKFKFARIWGKSARFDGQTQGLEHELKDDDVVELHLK